MFVLPEITIAGQESTVDDPWTELTYIYTCINIREQFFPFYFEGLLAVVFFFPFLFYDDDDDRLEKRFTASVNF